MSPLSRRLLAEAIGSAILFATVVGSGIMADRLSGGNVAVALLGNTLATGAILYVLIAMLGPISGAQFNPAVTLVMRQRNHSSWLEATAVLLVQVGAGIAGVWLAHAMFDLPILQVCNVWPDANDPGHLAPSARVRAGQCRFVHYRRLLVHVFHQLRQSGDHHCPQPERQFCRDCPC